MFGDEPGAGNISRKLAALWAGARRVCQCRPSVPYISGMNTHYTFCSRKQLKAKHRLPRKHYKVNFIFVILLDPMIISNSLKDAPRCRSHLSQALLSHLFGIDMSWGATSKEADNSNFFLEIPKVLKKFKFSLLWAIACMVGMIILAQGNFIPHTWNITQFIAIFPMAMVAGCHFLLPIALNPALMTFSW